MDGYYDPIVTHFLDKPICICGFWGSRLPKIAIHLSSYTGIPFADLERKVEHDLGISLPALKKQNRMRELMESEQRCLNQIMKTRPFPVVALRPETLMSPQAATFIKENMRLIYIASDIVDLQQRILILVERPIRTRLLDIEETNVHDISSVTQTFQRFEQSYLRADTLIKVKKQNPRQVAKEIIQLLDKQRL